ncbi:MAG: CoA binding protein [Thermodesulfobacteriota bacterium]|nr:CoA binding protein [Thermodesulfobacteriota bacterium]
MLDGTLKSLFLCPRSVVFVGIPRKSGPGALNPVDNLRNWGYEGDVAIVHPHVKEIAGMSVLSSLSELTAATDLAVVSTPRETVPGIIRECGLKSIRAVIVTNQGFAESDLRGKELQRDMITEAKNFGIRILGPNTLGVSNAFHLFNSSFMPLARQETPIGVVCQSGVFFVGAAQLLGGMGIGIDVGNACDVNIVDALEWLGTEERIRVVAVHAEQITDGSRFISVAEEIGRRIPIVALKTGRSLEGAKSAASHSGSLAADDRMIAAAFQKAGILRVLETQDQRDLVRAFTRLPEMRGPRVAIVTLTGAGGIILLDAMERHGLQPAVLSSAVTEGLRNLSPDWMPIANPMDIWPAVMKNGMQKAYGTALRDVLADPNVDGVICVALGLGHAEQQHLGAEQVIQELSAQFDKPVVVWLYGSQPEEAVYRLEGNGRALAVPSLERAVRVLAAMMRYAKWKNM